VKLGVVIPTLDEAESVEAALRSVVGAGPGDDAPRASRSEDPGSGPAEPVEIEIVVADGGSRDDTCPRVRRWGAEMTAAATAERTGAPSHPPPRGPSDVRVLELGRDATAGRSGQLQAGFEVCGGDAVLFLHADTRLPVGWAEAVRDALADPAVAGGAFRFAFDPSEPISPALRLIEWGAHLRVALFGLPYGDQAIFARRRVLEAMGGVPQAPLMEDLDLVRGLKRHGRLVRLPLPATTSARRYRAGGVGRTFLRNLGALLAWRLGLDRARVAAWYRS
jgi:glycosyltransferase involved in cell wall biosynthesis